MGCDDGESAFGSLSGGGDCGGDVVACNSEDAFGGVDLFAGIDCGAITGNCDGALSGGDAVGYVGGWIVAYISRPVVRVVLGDLGRGVDCGGVVGDREGALGDAPDLVD